MLFSVIAATAFASAPDMSNADLSGRWDAHASLNSCTFSGATDREGASSGVAIDGREDIVHAIAHNGFIRGSHCWANPKTTERLYGTDMVCRNFHGVVDIETGEFLANMQYAGDANLMNIRGRFSERGERLKLWRSTGDPDGMKPSTVSLLHMKKTDPHPGIAIPDVLDMKSPNATLGQD